MSKIIDLNSIESVEFLDSILYDEITIFEDVQGSKIFLNWDGEKVNIKASKLSNNTINMVDLAMQNYYNKAVSYFEKLDNRVKSLLNKKWWFGFEYFPDNMPANLEYDRIPKNSLILTSIYKRNRFNYTDSELEEYARLLDVDILPVLYRGTLDDESVNAIKYFLNTSPEDLDFVFGEQSFAFFFYKLLNPQLTSSFLMNNGNYQKNLEKLIIKSKSATKGFQILNPLYNRVNTNDTYFVNNYTLIIINFLAFVQNYNISKFKLKGKNRDEVYINLISFLFNEYMGETIDDYIAYDIIIPEFFDKDKFRINKKLITNKLTKEYITGDKRVEYIFKILLGTFNKKRSKPIGILSNNTLELLNNFIENLNKTIDLYLKKLSEIELAKRGLINIKDFFDLKFDIDGDGNVYPSIWDEIKSNADGKSKKKTDKISFDKNNLDFSDIKGNDN